MEKAKNTRFPVEISGLTGMLKKEPVFIDGMRVMFDKKVTLMPVTRERKENKPQKHAPGGTKYNNQHHEYRR